MRGVRMLVLSAALTAAAPLRAETAPCPAREVGAAYPWQNLKPMKGDRFAWIFIDVDRTGRPIRCRVGENNIPDPESRFRVCQAFSGDWRAPVASAGDPDVRTIKRHFTMIGYEHQMADKKARKAWFKAHPEERPDCYPE